MAESHWLLWLLGPATVAFAVPVCENRQLMRRHWLSLSVGVVASVVMAVGSTVLLGPLAQPLRAVAAQHGHEIHHHPFAVEATRSVGGNADLTALFVVLTGVIGMAVGESVLTVLAIRSRLGKARALVPRPTGPGQPGPIRWATRRGGLQHGDDDRRHGHRAARPSWAGCSGNSTTR